MNVLCRHCFRLFDFRRVGVLCRSRRCAAVLDIEGRRRPRFMLPDVEKGLWGRRGQRLALDAPCPYCEERGRLAPACPRCRQPLDPDIGAVEDRIIGVLGARDSGKSHFLSTLLHLLLREGIGDEVWAVGMDHEARQAAEETLLRPLFDELVELPMTSRGLGPEFRPVLTHRAEGRRVLLVFRDLSGEDLADRKSLEGLEFLRYAEGVVLLADPLALDDRGRGSNPSPESPGKVQLTCADILDNYRAVLEDHPRRPGEEELALLPDRKFLAVTVTKADLFLRSNHAFWSPNGNAYLAPGFWQARVAESEIVRKWLHRRLANPTAFARSVGEFVDASYFFTSSYGYRHKPHTKLHKPPQPVRVHEPIFALLDRFATRKSTDRPFTERHRTARPPATKEDEDVL